jgi:hypothetical protein
LEPFWQPFCDHFGIILGAILDAILSPFWVHFESILGGPFGAPFWGHFEVILGVPKMIDFWRMSQAKCSFGTPKKEEIRHPKMGPESGSTPDQVFRLAQFTIFF